MAARATLQSIDHERLAFNIQKELDDLSIKLPQEGRKIFYETSSIQDASKRLVAYLNFTKNNLELFKRVEACRLQHLRNQGVEIYLNSLNQKVEQYFSQREASYKDLESLTLLRKRVFEEQATKENVRDSLPSCNPNIGQRAVIMFSHRRPSFLMSMR